MSDPLSIAAGVAGLLSLGIQVSLSLVDYYSAYTDRDAQIGRTLGRLSGLGKLDDYGVSRI